MSVKLPGWATRGGVPPLDGDPGLAERLVAAAVRKELIEEEIDAVRALCARVDGSDWIWELIDRWEFKGDGEQAMFRLFAWLADDDDVSRLGEILRKRQPWSDNIWARVAPRRRALQMLAAVDTPLGWLEIMRFRDQALSDDLYKFARDLLRAGTRARQWSWEMESDLCAPTLGFEDGARAMDYGPRVIRLRATSDAYEFVDETGAAHDRLPRRRKSDDAEKVAVARERWRLLRPQLDALFALARQRLERAMVRGDKFWWYDRWRAKWLDHPLLGAVAREVVWRGYKPYGYDDFFFLDPHEAVDVGLNPIDLEAVYRVEVAHPSAIDVAAWTELLAEHEVVQPIEQVGRDLADPGDVVGTVLDPEPLIDATRRGWDRRARTVGPLRDEISATRDPISLWVLVSPGLAVSKVGRLLPSQVPQRIESVEVRDLQTGTHVAREDWPPELVAELGVLVRRAQLRKAQ